VDIRFVSSLTPDDENRLAPALLSALGGLLDQLPIAYTLRVETAAGKGYARSHVPEGMGPTDAIPDQAGLGAPSPVGLGGNGRR